MLIYVMVIEKWSRPKKRLDKCYQIDDIRGVEGRIVLTGV
jgi:hypothetical protein